MSLLILCLLSNISLTLGLWIFVFRNVDIKTGFRTKSVLCEPVRDHRGGGSIVAVIQMLNKIGGGAFDQSDEDALAACTQRVADDISTRFKELLSAASKFAGTV